MMDPATAYFLKKYYPHVIKWWLVMYNPEVFRIWPSKAERDEALRIEAEEAALLPPPSDAPALPQYGMAGSDTSAFNVTTGSYSGLYGQQPIDANTQAALDAIMHKSSNQSSIDFLIAGNTTPSSPLQSSRMTSSGDVIIPSDQDEVIREANEIYERLLREAAEDEAKKQAEIDEMRRLAEAQFSR